MPSRSPNRFTTLPKNLQSYILARVSGNKKKRATSKQVSKHYQKLYSNYPTLVIINHKGQLAKKQPRATQLLKNIINSKIEINGLRQILNNPNNNIPHELLNAYNGNRQRYLRSIERELSERKRKKKSDHKKRVKLRKQIKGHRRAINSMRK